MSMLINLDSYFPRLWSEKLGDRVFECDAFLSHNRDDGSDRLAEELRRLGVAAWYDGNADLRDRRVLSKIDVALRHARYVVCCVHANYRDSHWVRAEYLGSLRREERDRLTRVLVAETTPDAKVPVALRDRPRFAVWRDGPSALATYVREGNRLPFPAGFPGDVGPLIPDKERRWLLKQSATIAAGKPEPGEEGFTEPVLRRAIARAVRGTREGRRAGAEFDELWFGARNVLGMGDYGDGSGLSPETIRMIRAAALWFGESPDTDNRANSAMVLDWLHEHGHCHVADLLEFLRREREDSVIECVLPGVVRSLGELSPGDWAVVQLASLRAPHEVSYRRELLDALPEAIRDRVRADGLDESLLTIEERLLRRRELLEHLLGDAPIPRPAGPLEPLLGTFGVTDLELFFRDLSELIREVSGPDESGGAGPIRKGLLDLFVLLAERTERDPRPLLAMGDYVCDFIIHPLLSVAAEACLRERARAVLDAICRPLDGTKWAKEVPCYREAFEMVARGEPLDAADSALSRCMMKLGFRG